MHYSVYKRSAAKEHSPSFRTMIILVTCVLLFAGKGPVYV